MNISLIHATEHFKLPKNSRKWIAMSEWRQLEELTYSVETY